MAKQHDKSFVAFLKWQHDGCAQVLVGRQAFTADVNPNPDVYAPVLDLSEEIFFAAWETSALKRVTSVDPMDLDLMQAFEPLRPMIDLTPPKRFYRTFWRSAARWIMQHQKQMDEEES